MISLLKLNVNAISPNNMTLLLGTYFCLFIGKSQQFYCFEYLYILYLICVCILTSICWKNIFIFFEGKKNSKKKRGQYHRINIKRLINPQSSLNMTPSKTSYTPHRGALFVKSQQLDQSLTTYDVLHRDFYMTVTTSPTIKAFSQSNTNLSVN